MLGFDCIVLIVFQLWKVFNTFPAAPKCGRTKAARRVSLLITRPAISLIKTPCGGGYLCYWDLGLSYTSVQAEGRGLRDRAVEYMVPRTAR